VQNRYPIGYLTNKEILWLSLPEKDIDLHHEIDMELLAFWLACMDSVRQNQNLFCSIFLLFTIMRVFEINDFSIPSNFICISIIGEL